MSEHFRCRSCGGEPAVFCSLGATPLANALITPDRLGEPEPRYPLDLAFCPSCTLVQITETVPPEVLFSDYPYFSSYSDTVLKSARQVAEEMIGRCSLGAGSSVVEVASNDGYLLQYYERQGIPVLGIEPASNIAAVARERGIRTIDQFFGKHLAEELVAQGSAADVIHANNVLAHVADLNGFVAGIATLLKPHGIGVIEVPYVIDLIERCEFDTIYHEHLCYFSLSSLEVLFARHGLVVADVERIEIHGGSLRVFVCREGRRPSGAVVDMLRRESRWGVGEPDRYRSFAGSIRNLESELKALLGGLKADGKRIAAYGASAKGSTLLNVFGIGRETLDFVVDRSPAKHGRLMPGVHLPIYPAEYLLESKPDYALLLTWNFADEILNQQRQYRTEGGRFIVPIPQVRII